MLKKGDIIRDICSALLAGERERALKLAESYPMTGQPPSDRKFSALDCMKVFVRDGFIDRYSPTSERLVFPGTLRLLSLLLPERFPFDPHWRMEVTHPAYWELFPTIDHEISVARQGKDDESNWVTTSQWRNSAKSSWTLEELGWKKYPPGRIEEWDGLTGQFMKFTRASSELLRDQYLARWHRAAKTVLQ
jgi:hypothetical protein